MTLPKNTCLAPFVVATINPMGNQSPCPTLGGDHWDFAGRGLQERWVSPELNNFRDAVLNNEQLPACVRCWSEEAVGGYSFRKELYNPDNDPEGTATKLFGSPIPVKVAVKEQFYHRGPMQLVMKVNNVCNLRCRSCNAMDSVLYKTEGRRYQEKYGVNELIYTRGADATYWTDEQLREIFEFSGNLRRLELYGGEPLLDKQTPKLLKMLADSGRSQHIVLNVSTNGTIRPNDEWIDTVSKFSHFNLNLSIDGIGDHFTYLRHPGNWGDVKENIDFFHNEFRDKLKNNTSYTLLPVVTLSILNVFYLPEIVTELQNLTGVFPHINLVRKPWYYRIDNMPDGIKKAVEEKLIKSGISQLEPYIKFMNETPMDPVFWNDFKFWTHAKDEYRDESFANTFPEFFQEVIKVDTEFNEPVQAMSHQIDTKF